MNTLAHILLAGLAASGIAGGGAASLTGQPGIKPTPMPSAPAARPPATAAQPASAPSKWDLKPLRATLVAEKQSVAPGGTLWLGIALDIDPEWHTYWPGENDTGAPIKLNWTVPPGWSVGEVLWPEPTRHVSDGDLLDSVLEGQQMLLVPITVPREAQTGTTPLISLKMTWLVCKSACVPGDAALELETIIAPPPPYPEGDGVAPGAGGKPVPTPDAPRFEVARARVPKPFPSAGSAKFEGDSLVIRVPGVKSLAFAVGAGSMLVKDPIKTTLAASDTLRMPVDRTETERKWVHGVVQATDSDGKTSSYTIHVPKPD